MSTFRLIDGDRRDRYGLIEQRVAALEARTVDEPIGVAVRMLRLAVSLPLTPDSHLVDKAALWLFDDKAQTWSVVASPRWTRTTT